MTSTKASSGPGSDTAKPAKPSPQRISGNGFASAAEVADVRERMKDAGRHAVQSALMPYDHLLPERFRGRNERIDEPLGASGEGA